MTDEDRQVRRINNSGFIQDYVRAHKQELDRLRARADALDFVGEWFIIGDEGYTEKRTQYATTSFEEAKVSPRIILYPAPGSGDEDIAKAISLCADLDMSIAVRTGGHQYCGYSSTPPINMQIDLSKTYPEYKYDAEANVLRCGVSHALGDWAALNESFGIYLPMGVCSHVHLGGHVHTGGWGMVARSHGLLADHVLAFDIILADGANKRIVRPVDGQADKFNDDVYYAVLGGSKGGDFGIVTHWEFSPLRDKDYPNSACYTFTWLWTEDKMEGLVRRMEELTRLCASGGVPSDYEFMLTVTGAGVMNLLPDKVSEKLEELGLLGKKWREVLGIPVPGLIQMWMCFTNKGGAAEEFNDQWFESFAAERYGGEPLLRIEEPKTAVSHGLAHHFIMKQDREMEYPFIKRSRVSMELPKDFYKTYTQRMEEITGWLGFDFLNRQHLVSQQQIYAGGAVAEKGKLGLTSYSWRDQHFALSHDSFYDVGRFGNSRKKAEAWQAANDKVFIGEKRFADADMRMFAYTFGERKLEKAWRHYYDSEDKYDRLRAIKKDLDPTGLFSPDEFSIKAR